MIFSLQFILIFAGYGAVANLSGSYIELYTGANDFQLGLYFMIPHFLHIARPFIGAQADRNQSHKRIYSWCALIAAISYLPYILLPFLIKNTTFASLLTNKYRFWLLTVFHITGSIALNGCRTLADALAKNYANRVKIEYVSMRKFAPVGMGLCSYLFGFLNEEWILPDFVPSMMLFSGCMLTLAMIVHVWPDDYFVIMCSADEKEAINLPSTREILHRAGARLIVPFKKSSSYDKQVNNINSLEKMGKNISELDTNSVNSVEFRQKKRLEVVAKESSLRVEKNSLTLSQQINILLLVLKRDFRISLAFMVLFIAGWTCRSGQNFVFVQLNDICETRRTCHPGKLSGNVLAGACILEFLTYVMLNACKKFKLNRNILMQLALLSIAVHYYFFAFFVEHLSPNWFIVDSLNGLEFAIIITSSLNWGYTFASEVEYIIPELKEKNIIDENDDLNLVKVSLVATMMSCMTLLFEGFGSTLGSFVYGVVIQELSFSTAWKINGSLALLEFAIIFLVLVLNQCLHIRPKMKKLKTESMLNKEIQPKPA